MKCIGILWNSMDDFVENAVQDIGDFANVESVMQLNLKNSFSDFVTDIYGYHTPETKWKIDYKLKNSVDSYSSRNIYVLFIEITVNTMEYIERKGVYVPKEINDLKKMIRSKYSNIVDHYAFDNVFHMTESEEEYAKSLIILREYCKKINETEEKPKLLSLGNKHGKQR